MRFPAALLGSLFLAIACGGGGGGSPAPAPGTAPSITAQPEDRSVPAGQAATFEVQATGTAPLAYQWRRNGAILAGAVAVTYVTPTLAASDDGARFSVVVSNSHGSATSREALLQVTSGGCPKPPLATGFAVLQPPVLAEPPARSTFTDPVFGTCVTRVTDRVHDLLGGDPSAGLKNEYSRVQSYNADESRLLIRGIDASWYVYDAQTLLVVRRLPFDGSVDPRWDGSNPNYLYFHDGTRFLRCDIRSGDPTLVRDFATDFPGAAFVWTRWEGSPSADGRWWGFMAQDGNARILAFLIYDLQTNTITARRDFTSFPGADSVTLSPSGNHFLVQVEDYCATGQLGTDAHPCGLMVYDKNLQNGRGLLRIVGHSDLAYDSQGREVMVYQDIDTDSISMVDLLSGQITALWPIDFSHTSIGLHLSGRAFQRPGWALVSTHDGDVASHTWMDDSLFAVELKAGGRVVRLAHTHSLVDEAQEHDYWAEPQATVNRDFTKILFTSNWGRSGSGATECFRVQLPSNGPASLPVRNLPRSSPPR